MNLIEQGIFHNLIIISEDEKQITYCNFHRPRNYNNPEEKVQAENPDRLAHRRSKYKQIKLRR